MSINGSGPIVGDGSLAAARVAGTIGDVLGRLDEASVAHGRLLGRVEVLQWCQDEIKVQLNGMKVVDRFADTRGLESLLDRVRDSLAAVQDGSGEWAGLVRTDVGDSGMDTAAGMPVPEA